MRSIRLNSINLHYLLNFKVPQTMEFFQFWERLFMDNDLISPLFTL